MGSIVRCIFCPSARPEWQITQNKERRAPPIRSAPKTDHNINSFQQDRLICLSFCFTVTNSIFKYLSPIFDLVADMQVSSTNLTELTVSELTECSVKRKSVRFHQPYRKVRAGGSVQRYAGDICRDDGWGGQERRGGEASAASTQQLVFQILMVLNTKRPRQIPTAEVSDGKWRKSAPWQGVIYILASFHYLNESIISQCNINSRKSTH